MPKHQVNSERPSLYFTFSFSLLTSPNHFFTRGLELEFVLWSPTRTYIHFFLGDCPGSVALTHIGLLQYLITPLVYSASPNPYPNFPLISLNKPLYPHDLGFSPPFYFTFKSGSTCILTREVCLSFPIGASFLHSATPGLLVCALVSSILQFLLRSPGYCGSFHFYHSLPFSIAAPSFVKSSIPGLQHALFCLQCVILLGALLHCI